MGKPKIPEGMSAAEWAASEADRMEREREAKKKKAKKPYTSTTRLLIYGGYWMNSKKALRHLYLPLDNDDWQNAELPERSAYSIDVGLEDCWWVFDSCLVKYAAVGAVIRFAVNPKKDGSVGFKPAPKIVGHLDADVRSVWAMTSQATYDGHRALGAAKKEKKRDFVTEALAPVHEAYTKCKNPAARRALLARVLEAVTRF